MTISIAPASGASRTRDTIFVEDARVISVATFPGDQYIVRLQAPRTAARAVPGTFVHLQCDPALPMRRPLSIMRVDAEDGWLEILFKIVGNGLRALGQRQPGNLVSLLGPIGNGFRPAPGRPRTLLIGGGVGIPPMVFLAERLWQASHPWQPLVLMGSEIPFPFNVTRSAINTDWIDPAIDGAMPLMDDWRIPCRLASSAPIDRTYRGYVTDLARAWLLAQAAIELEQSEIFACGPTLMLEAVAGLAREFDLPCQVALEEFMACAVGGCAGCTVLVETDDGPAMKRVCVDGPVFDAATVFPGRPIA